MHLSAAGSICVAGLRSPQAGSCIDGWLGCKISIHVRCRLLHTTKSEDVFQGRERAEGEELLPQSFRANARHNARIEPGVKAGRAQICGGDGEFFLVHGKVVESLVVLLLRLLELDAGESSVAFAQVYPHQSNPCRSKPERFTRAY